MFALQVGLAEVKLTRHLLRALSDLIGHAGQLSIAEERADVLQLLVEEVCVCVCVCV